MLTLAFVLVEAIYWIDSFRVSSRRIAGIDIRQAGSGNIGATNVVRVLGKRYGYPVFFLDFFKVWGPLRLPLPSLEPRDRNGVHPRCMEFSRRWQCHWAFFPPWLKFRGGKGVATAAGALSD